MALAERYRLSLIARSRSFLWYSDGRHGTSS